MKNKILLCLPTLVLVIILCGVIIIGLTVYGNPPLDQNSPNQAYAIPLIKHQSSAVLCPFNKDHLEIEKNECVSSGCVWNSSFPQQPSCFLPDPFSHGYSIVTEEEFPNGDIRLRLKLIKTSLRLFPDTKEDLDVNFIQYNDKMLRIKITVPNETRYEVPIELNHSKSSTGSNSSKYTISFTTDESKDYFAIRIRRKATGTLLFDTSIGGLTYADQFLQVSTALPSTNLYGLGENSHYSFRHDLNYKTWPMFARDQGPQPGEHNLYGIHPVYYVVEDDGNSHAVFWLNSNAMEAETLPSPGLTLRSIGGIMDFFFFMGPTPSEVVSQYTSLIGRPFMPPYWALGFQLCRYGHPDLKDMEAAMMRTRRHGIPQDIQYADIDHMDRQMDFTIGPNFSELPQLIKDKKKDGLRFIFILDSAINAEQGSSYPVYQRGLDQEVYIKWFNKSFTPSQNFNSGDIMLGYVWPENRTAFPDFFKSRTHEWWSKEIELFYDKMKFDGIWIDMNEPANFGTNLVQPWNWPKNLPPWSLVCPSSKWDDPPYPTKAARIGGENRISDKTICMIGLQGEIDQFLHYDVHNLYGWAQTKPTMEALQNVTGKRGIVVTRSTYPSSGKWSGHWLGDNTARWVDLKASITGMMEFNMFGIPYVGADICGFFEDTTEELCERWMQIGAFYPYARNHNSKGFIDQDPGKWASVAYSGRQALRIRYTLLPFLYTLHFDAATDGLTVIRPLFFEYPQDEEVRGIDDQFLWGPSLMIAPIVEQGSLSRTVYFPYDVWYDYYEGILIEINSGGKLNVSAPRSHIPLYLRGGHILPTQRPASNTEISRKQPLGLIISPDWNGEAAGHLYWDDGESIDAVGTDEYYMADFAYKDNKIDWSVTKNHTSLVSNLKLSDLRVFNVSKRPLAIYKNDERWTKCDWHYNPFTKVLQVFDFDVNVNENFSISWKSEIDYKLPCPIPYTNGWNDDQPVTEELCLAACVWNAADKEIPCRMNSNSKYGYKIDGKKILTEKGFKIPLKRINSTSMFGNDITDIILEVFMYSDTMLRFKFINPNETRYEVPINLNIANGTAVSPLYEVHLESEEVGEPFGFYVIRKDSGNILFDTRIGGFSYANQFLSISSLLPSKNVFGLGENNHKSFRHDLQGKIWPIFSRDQPPKVQDIEQNLYGAQTFYQVQENDGNSHGVFLLNSNAIDYQLLDYPAITFRTIGGILDFFLVAGPTPEEVVSQYTGLVHRPFLPPYWALGFQICRYGYKNTKHVEEVLNRTSSYEIPQDVQYVDIDYMDRRMDFTLDKKKFGNLSQLFSEIRNNGMRTIIILDPAINAEMPADEYPTHQNALSVDAYITWSANTPIDIKKYNNLENDIILGYVWPENRTAFPNFHKLSTKDWWTKEILSFYNTTIPFDGIWVDMNEPAVFDTNMDKPWNWPPNTKPWNLKCPRNHLEDPPYVTKAAALGPSFRMSDKTLCMSSYEKPFLHYDVHNIYGWTQTEPTLRAAQLATGERSIVISRSTYAGSGQWAGHWLGDNEAIWPDMHRSIIGMLEFNLFGIPYIGADICGFFGNTTEELCQRWMQLGAFYPFARNHNGIDYIDQDPGMWPEVAKVSRDILNIRYSLLPYLYTLFYHSKVSGGTVVRPLHHEFPKDRATYGIDTQFLWGPALMISPVLQKGALSREIYFPMDFWYNYYTGQPIEWPGETRVTEANLDTIPLHLRGGYILPMQQPSSNTKLSRENPFEVLVALNSQKTAKGMLFWDDGGSENTIEEEIYDLISFKFDHNIFNMTITTNSGLLDSLTLGKITFYGIEYKPSNITVNENDLSEESFIFDSSHLKLTLHVELPINENLIVILDGIWR